MQSNVSQIGRHLTDARISRVKREYCYGDSLKRYKVDAHRSCRRRINERMRTIKATGECENEEFDFYVDLRANRLSAWDLW